MLGTPVIGFGNGIANNAFQRDLLCTFQTRKGLKGSGMIGMRVRKYPCGNNDFAILALVELLERAVNLHGIQCPATVIYNETAVCQCKDIALADVITVAVFIVKIDN